MSKPKEDKGPRISLARLAREISGSGQLTSHREWRPIIQDTVLDAFGLWGFRGVITLADLRSVIENRLTRARSAPNILENSITIQALNLFLKWLDRPQILKELAP